MIKELYCKNFKIFREVTTVSLSPLTIVTGPNNSGKSSLLDLVRLLDTEGDRALYDINLSMGDHRNRTFEDLLSDTEGGKLEVGFRSTLRHGRESYVEGLGEQAQEGGPKYRFAPSDDVYLISRFDSLNGNHFLSSKEVYFCSDENTDCGQLLFSENHELGELEKRAQYGKSKSDDDDSPDEVEKEFFRDLKENMEAGELNKGKSTPIENIHFGAPKEGKVIRDTVADDGWDQEDNFISSQNKYLPHSESPAYKRRRDVEWTFHAALWEIALQILRKHNQLRGQKLEGFSVGDYSVSQFARDSVHSEAEVPSRPGTFGREMLRSMLRRSELSPPEWLPPNREDTWLNMLNKVIAPLIESVEKSASIGGSHIPSFRARPRRYYGEQDQLTNLLRQYRKATGSRRDEVNRWLETFDIGTALKVEKLGPNLFEAYVNRNGGRRYLSDLGSGSAQLLPMILSVAGPPQWCVLVEEPEANLHPDLQARLADLFVEMIGRGTQVIIETHSEYLVRRLQYLVAKGECRSSHTSIAYLDAQDLGVEESPNVRQINIDNDGQLSEPFGPGFFDQSTNLMVDLFKYGSEN